MASRTATIIHRTTVTTLAAVTVVVVLLAAQDLRLIPPDVEGRFYLGPLHLVYGVYAALIALFVGWKAGHRVEGRVLSLQIGAWGLSLAMSVIPSGSPSHLQRLGFSLAWMMAFYWGFRFWTVFPHQMTVAEVSALRRQSGSPYRWLRRANDLSSFTVGSILGTVWGRVVLSICVLGLTVMLVGIEHTYSFVMPGTHTPSVLTQVLGVMGLAAILASGAFAWTGFRMADEEGQRKALWIVFAFLFTAGHAATATTMSVLRSVTASEFSVAATAFLNLSFQPVATFVLLTGYALAIFYSGALDLRPMISRATLYGGLLIVGTFLFALVEEFVESVITERLDVPDGLGAWAGAAVIALAMGPVRAKLDSSIKKVGSALEPSTDGLAPAASEPSKPEVVAPPPTVDPSAPW